MVVDVLVSTGATSASAPNASFDANHGANRSLLASLKQVSLPETVHGSLPRPFDYKIPFDQPFSYDGQGPLCWEIRVHTRQVNTVRVIGGDPASTDRRTRALIRSRRGHAGHYLTRSPRSLPISDNNSALSRESDLSPRAAIRLQPFAGSTW